MLKQIQALDADGLEITVDLLPKLLIELNLKERFQQFIHQYTCGQAFSDQKLHAHPLLHNSFGMPTMIITHLSQILAHSVDGQNQLSNNMLATQLFVEQELIKTSIDR